MPDQVAGRELARRRRDDVTAVTQDGGAFTQREDLLQPMADEQDRQAAVAQRSDD